MADRSGQESRAAAPTLPRRQYHLPEIFKELPGSHAGSDPIEGRSWGCHRSASQRKRRYLSNVCTLLSEVSVQDVKNVDNVLHMKIST